MIRLNITFLLLIAVIGNISSQKKELGLNYLLQEKDYDGVILLYDYEKDKLYTSHLNKTDKRVLPASTFKILNTLIFLDLGVVTDTSTVLEWNGKEYKHKGKKIEAWCKDTNLADAFKNSTVWYYKALGNPISLSHYKKVMKKNKYGKIYGRDKEEIDFWNKGNKIGVSARDQIKFLVKLRDNKLKFKVEHQNLVKDLMIVDSTKDYILRAKSGWTETEGSKFRGGLDLGWYIGYIEYVDNSYFFAIRLEKPADVIRETFSRDRIDIAKTALGHQFNILVK
jgi:beta-lactamase class D